MVVTRFAPSPTGDLHIGGLRTALFNFLYAKHFGGKFLLRIEDTDKKRSDKRYLDSIFDGIKWLGIEPDEIVYQSKNYDRHVWVANFLLKSGFAYKKDGAVRLKVDKSGHFDFKDIILGQISVSSNEVEDVVILRSDGTPTYTLAVVVDDYDMGVTHIIRGSDHTTNTFRQILIYKAMGWQVPNFAHIPLIHNIQGAKLSKRDGAASVLDFCKLGVLKEALFNYLLRLGWSCGNKEIFCFKEAIELFNLESVGKSPAKFEIEKLFSLNSHYLKNLPIQRLLDELLAFDNNYQEVDQQMLKTGIEIFRPRVKSIKEFAECLQFYIQDIVPESEIDLKILQQIKDALKNVSWDENLGVVIKQLAKDSGIAIKDIYTNLRLAILGKKSSPAILDLLISLGRERAMAKIESVLFKI